jgi:uncharacterized protein YndB with AHSA1/START domain
MVEIEVRATAAAPVDTVWSVLAAQAGMATWAPVRKVTLERQGDPPPDGVGTIRVLSRPPLTIREQITAVEAPVRLVYRMLSGMPVRDYVGETTLTARDGATEIRWRVTMTARFPGVTVAVRSVVHALVDGLVAESERIARQ